MATRYRYGEAIVIGGSMAGLLATRVLSETFAQVTLIERDRLPATAMDRSGVPQSVHAHALLAHGRLLLNALFPDLDQALEARGAPLTDILTGYRIILAAGPLPVGNSHCASRMASRVVLEHEVRQRVLALPNVRLVEHTSVTGLLFNRGNGRVEGVELRSRGAERAGDATSSLRADWVVDASGRGSKAPSWFAAIGYPAPEVIKIESTLSYATQWFEGVSLRGGTHLGVFPRAPDVPRAAQLIHVGEGRYICTIAGLGSHRPPADRAGYLEFARSLVSQELYDAIKDATPIGPIHFSSNSGNQWRQYHSLPSIPDRFVPMGDALCCFNPVYAQGMTVAACEAISMGRAIERSSALDGLASRILKAHTKIVSAAWTMATSEDYRWPVTKGAPANRATRIGHAYMDHVLDLAPHDFEVAKTFVHVMNMLAPPTSLFRPRILIQVLWRILRRKQPTQRRGPFPELPPEIARLVRDLPKQRVSAVEPR